MSKMIHLSPLINYATTFQLQTKICQKPYAKTPQKTHKNPTKIWWDKNFYIFLNIQTNKTMQTKFHLLLDRSEYTSTDIIPLQSMLKDYAHSEGAKTFQKTSIVSINDLTSSEMEEAWIEDKKYNGEDVTFIHWYNKHFYIIQTN